MIGQQLLLAARTVRHLTPGQIYWRLFYSSFGRIRRLPNPPDAVHVMPPRMTTPVASSLSWTGSSFRFLNQEVACGSGQGLRRSESIRVLSGVSENSEAHRGRFQVVEFAGRVDWCPENVSRLWVYNLHYFDFLLQPTLDYQEGIALITDWISRNPCCSGTGWEPYPISLRVVNWIKFISKAQDFFDADSLIATSLYRQGQRLRRSIEYHLLGNHLFKNGVALYFLGNVFETREAYGWRHKGRQILTRQIKEQLLSDGGHFERSPMYHALVLEDVLDCLNLARAVNEPDQPLINLLRQTATAMLKFLADIVHEDGSLPRFNDTTDGIAPTLTQLGDYASRLGVKAGLKVNPSRILQKRDFGLYILRMGSWTCIIDAGSIGPDYQPGHAHCDTLSYELSFSGVIIALNAGVFQYAGPEREVYRSTRSHNTLEIDGEEQHEIWSAFRVARRGYPRDVELSEAIEIIRFSGKHTGYERLPGRPVHQRDIEISDHSVVVRDLVLSGKPHKLRSFIHLHPEVSVDSIGPDCAILSCGGLRLRFSVTVGRLAVGEYLYSREFGIQEPAKVLVVTREDTNENEVKYSLRVPTEGFDVLSGKRNLLSES